MKTRAIQQKSFQFALQSIETVRVLQRNEREYTLSRQLLRSATSIGANVEEAGAAQSKRDFAAKMAIASKEARETHYWLRLLRDSRYLPPRQANELTENCEELIRLLTAIVKTTQNSLNIQH